MKTRITALLMALLLCIAFTSCSSKNNSDPISATKSATVIGIGYSQNKDEIYTIDLGNVDETLEQSIERQFQFYIDDYTIIDSYTLAWEIEEVDAKADIYDIKLNVDTVPSADVIEATGEYREWTFELDFRYDSGDVFLYNALKNGESQPLDEIASFFWVKAILMNGYLSSK